MQWLHRYLLIITGVVLAGIGAGIARPAVTFYVRYSLGSTLLAATALTSSFMLGRTIGSIASGLIGAKKSAYRWIVASGGILIASFVVNTISFSGEIRIVHILMSMWGLMAGMTWPTVQVGVADVRPSASNTLLSIYFAFGTLGISIGNKLFGVLDMSYSQMIKTGGILLLLSSPFFASSLHGLPRHEKARSMGGPSQRSVIGFAWILLVAFTIGFLSGMLRDYFYLYAKETLGMTRDQLGNILAVTGLLGVGSSIAAGLLADKYGAWRTLPVLTFIGGLGAYTLTIPATAAIGYVVAAISVRASLPQTRNATLLPGGAGAALVGLSNSVSSIGMMTGPLFAGIIAERTGSMGKSYLLAAGLLILSTIIHIMISIRLRKEKIIG